MDLTLFESVERFTENRAIMLRDMHARFTRALSRVRNYMDEKGVEVCDDGAYAVAYDEEDVLTLETAQSLINPEDCWPVVKYTASSDSEYPIVRFIANVEREIRRLQGDLEAIREGLDQGIFRAAAEKINVDFEYGMAYVLKHQAGEDPEDRFEGEELAEYRKVAAAIDEKRKMYSPDEVDFVPNVYDGRCAITGKYGPTVRLYYR